MGVALTFEGGETKVIPLLSAEAWAEVSNLAFEHVAGALLALRQRKMLTDAQYQVEARKVAYERGGLFQALTWADTRGGAAWIIGKAFAAAGVSPTAKIADFTYREIAEREGKRFIRTISGRPNLIGLSVLAGRLLDIGKDPDPSEVTDEAAESAAAEKAQGDAVDSLVYGEDKPGPTTPRFSVREIPWSSAPGGSIPPGPSSLG